MRARAPCGGRAPGRALAVLAVASGLLAACGGDDRRGGPGAAAPDARTAPATGDRAGLPACDAAGIDERQGRQGTCRTGDVVRTVVDRDRSLSFRDDLSIRLAGVRRREGMLLATLRVTNRGQEPLAWSSGAKRRVALWTGERLVAQTDRSARAARALGGDGAAGPIPPGATRTVHAGWPVPEGFSTEDRGAALIVVPGSELDAGALGVEDAQRIGVLRLWK